MIRLTRKIALAATIMFLSLPATAHGAVGVNGSPGWGDTVEGRNIPAMKTVLTDFKPDGMRMPYMEPGSDNGRTLDTLRFAAQQGFDTVLIDNATWSPEQVAAGAASYVAQGGRVTAVEGVNEPDVPATGYTPTPVPLSSAKLAEIAARQARLYDAVAGQFPVLCPSAVYQVNESALAALKCDVASIHRYPSNNDFPPTPQGYALPSFPKPIWVTETGVTSYKKGMGCLFGLGKWVVTPEQQRDYLLTQIAGLRSNGAARVFVYTLQNTGNNICQSSNNFGLYTWQHQPKPAAVALRG